MTNATSMLPSDENKSRADSDKISLTEILSTSEKIPVSAVKGVSDSIGSLTSSKSTAIPDSKNSISKSTEVRAVGENMNKTTKAVSSDKVVTEKISKSSQDSSENKEISKNNEQLETAEENIKKPNKLSSSTLKKSGLKEAPQPIVLLDSIRLDKKSEKSNKFNKTTPEPLGTTTSKKSSETNKKTTSADKSSTEIESKKPTKSSSGKTKNVSSTECNSLKSENDKLDSSKGSTINRAETVSSLSTDETVTNRRITRRTRSSNAEKVDLLTDEKSSNNKVLISTNKIEDNSSQAVSKRTRKPASEKNADASVENSTIESEKSDDKSSVDDVEVSQGKGKSLRKHKTSARESKDTTNIQPKSEETNTDTEQQSIENENEEQKSKHRGKSNSKANINSPAKTRSQTKQNANKSESNKDDLKKDEIVTIDLEDIEEQIVRTEIRPSKKLKLSDAVEITVVDRNKRTVTTEKVKDSEKESAEDDKKVPPRTRRSLRSNQQQSNADQNKVVKEAGDDKSDVEKKDNNQQSENKLIPVNEPKCVQKKVPLLTSVDEDKLKAQNEDEIESNVNKKSITSPDLVCSVDCEADEDNNDNTAKEAVVNAEEDAKDASESVDEPPMTMSSFKLDTEDVSAVRVTRKRAAQQSVDALREARNQDKTNQLEKKDEVDNKRPKLKKKVC
ncbi:hypothetical protein ILUMI_11655 [Ignelater luminosus]|uniref:Uncharacterized protein n=1 Tax=Ignelater luminosus TaxID=2038154 RepID=A0A8K0D039_IGNLU|nr:hypothetical protein ILUMI_11655 [Ignelater luminosus]